MESIGVCGVLCRQHIAQPLAALSSMLAAGAYARLGVAGNERRDERVKIELDTIQSF